MLNSLIFFVDLKVVRKLYKYINQLSDIVDFSFALFNTSVERCAGKTIVQVSVGSVMGICDISRHCIHDNLHHPISRLWDLYELAKCRLLWFIKLQT